MIADDTLGGYFKVHTRPPAFEGSDGQAYSVALYVDDEPDAHNQLGGALLFVRWSPKGEEPAGHLETPYLVHAETAAEVEDGLRALPLLQVKDLLDQAVARAREIPSW